MHKIVFRPRRGVAATLVACYNAADCGDVHATQLRSVRCLIRREREREKESCVRVLVRAFARDCARRYLVRSRETERESEANYKRSELRARQERESLCSVYVCVNEERAKENKGRRERKGGQAFH
eukprot:4818895-Pleurochrysis_carterae.AAC.1